MLHKPGCRHLQRHARAFFSHRSTLNHFYAVRIAFKKEPQDHHDHIIMSQGTNQLVEALWGDIAPNEPAMTQPIKKYVQKICKST